MTLLTALCGSRVIQPACRLCTVTVQRWPVSLLSRQSVFSNQCMFSTKMSKNQKKAVVFDLGGVIFKTPQDALHKYGEKLGVHG